MVIIVNENGAFVKGAMRKIVSMTENRNQAIRFADETVALTFMKKHGLSDRFKTELL